MAFANLRYINALNNNNNNNNNGKETVKRVVVVAAISSGSRIGWNKFRQLVPLLTNKDVSLIMRGRLYSSFVISSMLHEVRPGL